MAGSGADRSWAGSTSTRPQPETPDQTPWPILEPDTVPPQLRAQPRTQREGYGLSRPEDRHGGGADQRDQPNLPTPGTTTRSTVPEGHYVVILSGGQHSFESVIR
jgi:hypothetical protein